MSSSATVSIAKKREASNVVRRERIYDHLYDPVYTLSSQKDHVRATVKAYASNNRLRRVPEFASMFSDSPRFAIKLDPAGPVPASIDHRCRVHQEQRQEALQQLAGVHPNAQSWLKKQHGCQVGGQDSWKYYKRPLIPLGRQFPLGGVFAILKEDSISGGGHDEERPRHVTVGVQTDYRESETQTDPYSPEYVVQPGTSPSELLQLATLTWGHGLPAGLAEVELIERARAKRAWEASLPPLSDVSQLHKRWRMIKEMEAKEWALRDGEIQKLQDARLAVLEELLRGREEAQNDVTESRLVQMFFKLQNEKETRQQKIHSDHARSLRKLDAERGRAGRKLVLHGLVRDSPAYVPKIRIGVFDNQKIKKFDSHRLDTYEGLKEVESGLNASIQKQMRRKLDSKVGEPLGATSLDLMRKYKDWSQETNKKPERQWKLLVRKEKPAPRPPTPSVEQPPEVDDISHLSSRFVKGELITSCFLTFSLQGDEETELAVIHLQKLLRGRSTQYEMWKGKENHMDLIREQRSVCGLQANEQELLQAEKELVMKMKSQRDKQRQQLAQVDASRAGVVGAQLEQLFDTMSMELIHLQEERRIHALVLLAERDRRRREAEESGRRQLEERRRQEEDEVFRQVVQVHQQTVDLYLEDVILAAVEEEAEQQAREEIHKKMREINHIACAMEESRSHLQSEEIVSELMYSFLLPEVAKINVRKRVQQKQRPHLQATRSIIQQSAQPQTQSTSLQDQHIVQPSERASRHLLDEMLSPAEEGAEIQESNAE